MPPAARIGDMHICPMVTPGVPPIPHVGGPIAIGAPTVLIGMMPAARVGDMATCVGPPDTIAKGSPTVLICNMMAARMGDLTAHGGVIAMGFPTVLIGDVGVGSANSAGGAPGINAAIPTEVSIVCMSLSRDIDEIEEVAIKAAMAADVYDAHAPKAKTPAKPTLLPGNVTRISDNPKEMRQLFKGRLNDEQIKNLTAPEGSSYRAAIYRNENGKVFVVFRGTENAEGMADWWVNATQGTGFGSDHYESSKVLADAVTDSVGVQNTEIIGHSKGGGMAAAAGITTGAKTTTFNAAGLHKNTVKGSDISKADSNIDSYVVDGEVLNWVQDNRDVVHGTVTGVAGWLAGPLAGFAASIAVKDTAPTSAGDRRSLPAVWSHAEDPPAWYDPVLYRVTLHGMPKVIQGIAAKRDALKSSYEANGCPAQTGPR